MQNGNELDRSAAVLLKRLRIDRGLSPEQMPAAMGRHGVEPVSNRTIRRAEDGFIPTARVQFNLASFFDRKPSEIWRPERDRVPA